MHVLLVCLLLIHDMGSSSYFVCTMWLHTETCLRHELALVTFIPFFSRTKCDVRSARTLCRLFSIWEGGEQLPAARSMNEREYVPRKFVIRLTFDFLVVHTHPRTHNVLEISIHFTECRVIQYWKTLAGLSPNGLGKFYELRPTHIHCTVHNCDTDHPNPSLYCRTLNLTNIRTQYIYLFIDLCLFPAITWTHQCFLSVPSPAVKPRKQKTEKIALWINYIARELVAYRQLSPDANNSNFGPIFSFKSFPKWLARLQHVRQVNISTINVIINNNNGKVANSKHQSSPLKS